MKYRIWYSTESFADYIIQHTDLKKVEVIKTKLLESDANNAKNFHTMPDHIKKILYLDAPDLIVEHDTEPIFSIEVSTEAGTGHNVFQRFARLAASVENNVPAFYIYPEATIISRQNSAPTWDRINPLVFKALDDIMSIYQIPALFYYFPSDYQTNQPASKSLNILTKGLKYDTDRNFAGCPMSTDDEMKLMFQAINEVIATIERNGVIEGRSKLLSTRTIISRRSFMNEQYIKKNGGTDYSPLTATITIPTTILLEYLAKYENNSYKVGELLRSRPETIIYKVDSKFRGDPYPGALAAIDYLLAREGKTFEERKYNLVMAWGQLDFDAKSGVINLTSDKCSIQDFMKAVKASESKNLLTRKYNELKSNEVPRYYMQVRYGSTFSKVKHIRVFAYFADAILFHDGALWRDA